MSGPWFAQAGIRLRPYALCVDESSYWALMRQAGMESSHRWLEDSDGGCTHHFENGSVVCVAPNPDGIRVASILCHESVHIFQELCDDMGEDAPSPEFEAYTIDSIFTNLMRRYVELTK
jgi:hypothetical protein